MKIITLSKGHECLVDDEDYERISKFKWRSVKGNAGIYARRTPHKTLDRTSSTQQMHREIIGAKKGQIVDHINRNTLDNRRENLRLCTNGQNRANSKTTMGVRGSNYRGVYKRGSKFRTQLRYNNKLYSIGTFNSEKEAAIAYNVAALNFHGEFATLNKIKK